MGADAPAVAPALAAAQAFSGTIEYTAQRVRPSVAPAVRGVLSISRAGWSIEEAGPGFVLRATPAGAAIHTQSADFTVDDVFAADALANPWAVAFGQLAAGGWSATDTRSRTWTQPDGERTYVDEAGTRLLGVSDPAPQAQLAFVFGDWEDIGGMAVPHRILRLRAGASNAEFVVTAYRITRIASASAPVAGLAAPFGASTSSDVLGRSRLSRSAVDARSTAPAELFTLFGLLALAILVVAWLRRDALFGAACKRLADDPQAFRDEGMSAFVSPEGVLHFDGHRYKVGAQFYGRLARVQSSAFFVRVTADDVAAVVLPKKFGPVLLAPSRGFSLVEVMVAMTAFALAIVAGVYPALLAVSQANAFAAKRAAATRLAANALTDEELACAYGAAIDDGTKTTTAEGMVVTVSVTPSSIAGSHDIAVAVSDGSLELARVATVVGPPVPTPPPQPNPGEQR